MGNNAIIPTNPAIPADVYEAICRIVGYLAHDEIRNLADYGPDENAGDHIAQSCIRLAEWADGRLWLELSCVLERHGIAKQPSGKWACPGDAAKGDLAVLPRNLADPPPA
jgi:hypothetical protein